MTKKVWNVSQMQQTFNAFVKCNLIIMTHISIIMNELQNYWHHYIF